MKLHYFRLPQLLRPWTFGFAIITVLGLATVYPAPAGWAQSAARTVTVDGRPAEELWIETPQGRFRFTAEIADEPHERSQGLMFRETMPPTHGMLFDFGQTRIINMWMRNTPLSLDMVFLDRQGKVIRVAERTTPFSEAIITSGGPAAFVFEINGGVASLIGLKPGSRIDHRFFAR